MARRPVIRSAAKAREHANPEFQADTEVKMSEQEKDQPWNLPPAQKESISRALEHVTDHLSHNKLGPCENHSLPASDAEDLLVVVEIPDVLPEDPDEETDLERGELPSIGQTNSSTGPTYTCHSG